MGLEPGQLAVIYVGRIAPEKNLDLAVRAFRAIQAGIPARASSGRRRPGAQAAAGSAIRISFSPACSRGVELARHYASGDMFLFPEPQRDVRQRDARSARERRAGRCLRLRRRARAHEGDDVGACIPLDDADAFVAAAVALADDAPRTRNACSRARVPSRGLDPKRSPQFRRLLAALGELRDTPDNPELAARRAA